MKPKITIYVDSPTLRQRVIIFTYNCLIWVAFIIFKGERLNKELKELIKDCYSIL